jgi:hypothetical protein
VLDASWRWEDQEQALLSSCLSLIAIVHAGDSRVVQFSHFSPRLSASSGDISTYHISFEPAHAILGQACLGVLLRLDSRGIDTNIGVNSPLAEYAARHWVDHAWFENASSRLQKAMEYLFDPDKPQFAAWPQLYGIDTEPDDFSPFITYTSFSHQHDATVLECLVLLNSLE